MNSISKSDAEFAYQVSKLIIEDNTLKVNPLWKRLDDHARATLVVCIGYFIGRKSDKAVMDQRRKRGMVIQNALSKQITLIRGACKKRIAFEEMELMPFGKVLVFGGPVWPWDNVALSKILSEELIRLNALMTEIKRLYNVKRLGISGQYYWLVLAQEFLSTWSSRQLGETLKLASTDLAELIDTAFASTGRVGDGPRDAENLGKALANFRNNPANNYFCRHAPDLVSHWL